MSDWQARAAALLPCVKNDVCDESAGAHSAYCPAWYREHVAEALRDLGEKNGQLREVINEKNELIGKLADERDRLQGQLDVTQNRGSFVIP